MLTWLEQRLRLKEFFTRPTILRGFAFWSYLPGIFCLILYPIYTITGLCLASKYQFNTTQPLPYLLQTLHRVSGNLLLFFLFCYILHLFFLGIYRKPGELIWFCSWILFGLLSLSVITGYIIEGAFPTQEQLQQMHIQKKDAKYTENLVAEKTRMSLEKMPIFGRAVIRLLSLNSRNPKDIFQASYMYHTNILPLLLLFFFGLFLWLLDRRKIALRSMR
ncbi:MAG: cytochrome b N-terminal domain-containing protein [Planctomycetes bacterium]|jgi:quinol-cytochrome oxidoreductase complex cytochrome b subunit|nr:cytochrome b N-terminal domain-containing protein [Planctomycetota bacterium]HON45109.1 cytochrome b N-terminal domain-containing protein [Planctomycetota bacterium]HPY74602.1 cytochrome b N-terminal domain-containing protein [Planctomycetota bacterium]HQB00242.1 cytochrome b N-terminal domain-containing protein [Planctomycetota bacterium]HRU51216.1 cytochrome b N-terminal domain-containing protein [Planctomycetota bacterium]